MKCLKFPITWISILGVVFLNGSIFGVYSYLAEILGTVTKMSENTISIVLLVHGLANIAGNMIGGKELSRRPLRFVRHFPILLGIVYIVLFFMGELTIPMVILTFIWGVLAGAAGNINQYWITSVTFDSLEFGNGLFLAATNLGTTIGTTMCGLFITSVGINYAIFGGMLLLVLSFLLILLRIVKYRQIS